MKREKGKEDNKGYSKSICEEGREGRRGGGEEGRRGGGEEGRGER